MLNWNEIQESGFKPKKGQDFKILSIDGGGIRGIFPAEYLANIERETGKKINEYFDLVVGTSTGGIIALGIAAGIPMSEILELYLNNAKGIFDNKLARIPILSKLKWFTLLVSSLYSNTKLEEILKKAFKDKKINDADNMLCIPSIEYTNSKPKVYKTPHAKCYHHDKDLEMWKVALATAAAPLYFPSANEDGCKLDGGLWANNPILVGITEALKHNINRDDIKVLSIGTGEKLFDGKKKDLKHGGLISWNVNMIELVMNVQSSSAENISKYLIDENNITRINFSSNKSLAMDNTNDEYLKFLKEKGNHEFTCTYRNASYNVENKFFK